MAVPPELLELPEPELPELLEPELLELDPLELPEDFTGATAALESARVPLVIPREPSLFRYMICKSSSVISSV